MQKLPSLTTFSENSDEWISTVPYYDAADFDVQIITEQPNIRRVYTLTFH